MGAKELPVETELRPGEVPARIANLHCGPECSEDVRLDDAANQVWQGPEAGPPSKGRPSPASEAAARRRRAEYE